MQTFLLLTVALPLAGAVILLLGGKATDAWGGHLLGCAAVIGAFACGAVLFTHLIGLPSEDRTVHEVLFSWVPVGVLRVDFGLQLDALSMCFVLLITGVGGALIHIYSIGYMKNRSRPPAVFSPTSTCSSPRCCCWCSPTTTSASTWVGKVWVWRRTF